MHELDLTLLADHRVIAALRSIVSAMVSIAREAIAAILPYSCILLHLVCCLHCERQTANGYTCITCLAQQKKSRVAHPCWLVCPTKMCACWAGRGRGRAGQGRAGQGRAGQGRAVSAFDPGSTDCDARDEITRQCWQSWMAGIMSHRNES